MKKILITGANSYLGTSLKEYLRKWPEDYLVDTVDMVSGEWRKRDFSSYDVIYHVAGIAHLDCEKVSKSKEDLYKKINTSLAVETALKAKKEGVKQFIFMSSAAVYGDSSEIGKEKMITKDTPTNPTSIYGKTKLDAENELKNILTQDFKIAIVRAPMIYGSGCKGNFPKLLKISKLPIFPYIDNKRSMLYIGNLVEFIRIIISNSDEGIFYPQNAEYSNTSKMIAIIRKQQHKKTRLIKGFCWVIKFLSFFSKKVNKAFGSFAYDKTLSAYKENYCVFSLEQSIKESLSK